MTDKLPCHSGSRNHRNESGSGGLFKAPAASVYSNPISISEVSIHDSKTTLKLKKQHSFASDTDREEAWERKRDLHLMDMEVDCHGRGIVRSISDCGEIACVEGSSIACMKMRKRSLTDEDMEELRGCIDLGFGFKYDESYDLMKTLPALELYCAINKQYEDIRSGSLSPIDGAPLRRASSGCSPSSPLSDSWRVSSPEYNGLDDYQWSSFEAWRLTKWPCPLVRGLDGIFHSTNHPLYPYFCFAVGSHFPLYFLPP